MLTRLSAGIALAILLLVACNNKEWTQHDAGLRYKIFSHGQGDSILPGETMRLQIRQKYGDSVLSDTRDSIPFYQVYDSTQLSQASWSIFGQLRQGDSVVFEALVDSAFRGKLPPFAHKGEWLQTQVVVEEIFGVKEDWQADLRRQMERKRPQ